MQELRDYVGFTHADTERLRALWPFIEPETKAIVDRFYAAILRFEGTRSVLQDLAQVDRLKRTLIQWMGELCTGPHDAAYYERRQKIGRVHVRVGLGSQYMLTAMSLLREDMIKLARANLRQPEPTVDSLCRVTDIELAIMLSAYIETREEHQLADLRHVIVSHLPMCVLVLDVDGNVASTTDPHSRLFTQPELIGRPWDTVLDQRLIEAADLKTRVERAQATRREIVLPRVDLDLDGQATPASYRITIAPLDHTMAAMLLHIEDMTDVVAYEARAKRAEHLARLGTLAASVAHEIRNPLAGISGAVQVIQASMTEDDKRRPPLIKVQEQIARLGALVGDLLNFSRPVTVQLREVDLMLVAQTAASSIEGGTCRVVRANGDANDAPSAARAIADATLLSQVLVNVVQNAWQAGARTVEIVVDDASMQIVDDGPGVPSAMHDKIFEPFVTTKIRGTGLGLPIARKMLEAMNGTLTLCASPLGGAGFQLTLRPVD